MNKEKTSNSAQVASELSLEDAIAERQRGVKTKRDVQIGYNPYDAPPAEPTMKSRKTDLRRLSEWIRVQKQVEDLKKEDELPPEPKKP